MRRLSFLSLGLLALMLAVWSSAPATARVKFYPTEPLDVPPDWVRKPTSDELWAAWPANTLRQGLSGSATIRCIISLIGTLESCEVVTEDPPGKGFGAAALRLAPSFLLKPGQRDGQLVSTSIDIPVSFKTQGRREARLKSALAITEPVWEQAPTTADMAAAWPVGATADFGHVSMRCGLADNGQVQSCDVLTETPVRQGFAAAAKALAQSFKLRPAKEMATKPKKAFVNIPVHFINPSNPPVNYITEPRWLETLSDVDVDKAFTDAAEAAGVKWGFGIANCQVLPGGHLTDCRPQEEEPVGLGLGDAVVALAPKVRVNLWTDGGMPTVGARTTVAITWNND